MLAMVVQTTDVFVSTSFRTTSTDKPKRRNSEKANHDGKEVRIFLRRRQKDDRRRSLDA